MSEFSLETIFGPTKDSLNPFDRIAWIANCFEEMQNNPKWSIKPKAVSESD